MDVGQISQQLASRAEEIARHLLPAGKRVGNEWCVGSTDGEQGKSLKVHLIGGKAGVYADFATGQGGDLIDLWQAVRSLSLSDALREAKEYLGITEPQFDVTRPKHYKRPDRPDCRRPSGGVLAYLRDERGIGAGALTAYQVAETRDDKGEIIVFPFKRGNELINIKYLRVNREGGKKESWFSPGCELCLWGWQAIPDSARSVIITEGEIDAITWYGYGFPALSVPNGAKSHKWLENEFEHLERFQTIYLSFDMDTPGREGVAQLIERLGRHRCRNIILPHKDANECLLKGVTAEEMRAAYDAAETSDPSELKRASSYLTEVIEAFYPSSEKQLGVPTPWFSIQDKLRFRPGELTIWSGVTGHGKTTTLSHVVNYMLTQGETACIASFEMKARKQLYKMVRQLTGQRQPSVSTIQRAMNWYNGKLWVYDLLGMAKANPLLEVFEYAFQRYGIRHFIIDNLMRVGIVEDDYPKQTEFVNALTEFATSHDVHVHLVAHTRKKNDDKETSGIFDVKGTNSIINLAFNVMVTWKNKAKFRELAEARTEGREPSADLMGKPDGILLCNKQREGEWEDQIPLWFDQDSFQYVETVGQRPVCYLPLETEEEEEIWKL